MSPSIRSLADLGTLFVAAVPVIIGKPPRQEKSAFQPFIPCWRCRKTVMWSDAVITSTGDMTNGYGHPSGVCDPADIAEAGRLAIARA